MTRVTIRQRRVSADYKHNASGMIAGSETYLTRYSVLVDGRPVDSFLTRARAEQKAAELRAAFHVEQNDSKQGDGCDECARTRRNTGWP